MELLQSAIHHIDQTPAMIGEAERPGHKTVNAIVQYVMGADSLDPTDDKLRRKIVFSVKDCRKRMNARGV